MSLQHILILIAILPLAFAIERALFYLLERSPGVKQSLPPDLRIRSHLGAPTFWLLSIATLEIALPFFLPESKLLDRISNGLAIALIFICSWTITQMLLLGKIIIFSRLDISKSNNLRARRIRTQIQVLQKMVLAFVYVITIALILMRFDAVRRFGGSLIASAGLAGIILGFAAQKSLTNLLAGLQIAFTQPWDPLESTCRHASLSIL